MNTTSTIPDFHDVYRRPPHCYDPMHHLQLNDVNAYDLEKTKGLFDAWMNLRFKVILSSKPVPVDGKQCLGYYVEVLSFDPADSSKCVRIERHPDAEGQYFFDYIKATECFSNAVSKYDATLKAEVKSFVDINVYKDKIDYKVLSPSCCMNCKFCYRA